MKTRKHGRTTTAEPGGSHRPAGRSLSTEVFERHSAAVAILMNAFHLQHLVRVYRVFDGDLVEAVVLGEVAHHNVSALRNRAGDPLQLSALVATRLEPGGVPLLPTNPFSIAAATGIPRETVRRKVAALVAKGWLRRDGGDLFVTPAAKAAFAGFNARAAQDLLSIAHDIERLVGTPGPAAPRPRVRQPAGTR